MVIPIEADLKRLHEIVATSDLIDRTMYKQLIGCLMCLVNTGPYICYAINTLSQLMCESRDIHHVEAKHILRCVRGRVGYDL